MRVLNMLLLLFVFLAGFETGLPVGTPEGTALTPPDLLIGRITIKEVVLIIHALLNVRLLVAMVVRPRPALFVLACYLFCALGVVSSLINGYPGDLPQAFRFLLAAYFATAVGDYAERRGVPSLIIALTAGVAASEVINLFYSFTMPRGMLGFLPMLWGQNGPGGYAGFFVCLSYPLYRLLDRKWPRRLLMVTTLTSIFVVVISFSKLGMLMAAFGILAWNWQWLMGRRARLVRRFVVFVAVLWLGWGLLPLSVRQQAETIYNIKFNQVVDRSDVMRAYYYAASTEVALTHPLGVSFSGTGPAFNQTWAGRTGRLPPYLTLSAVNPHNSFLAFMVANGLLGLAPCILMFVFWFGTSRRALREGRRVPYAALALIMLTCLVFSNTLPGFFEVFFLHSIVLIMHFGAIERARQVRASSTGATPA